MNNGLAPGIGLLLVTLLILVVLFLVFREALCWYWKINERLGEMRKMQETLESLERKLTAGASLPASSKAHEPGTVGASRPSSFCPSCSMPIGAGNRFCEYCGAATGA